MTAQLLDAYRYDIEVRMADEGGPPLQPLIRPHEITAGGEIYKDDRVRVTAALNDHPPIRHSFGYRIDTADRSIVISGDTRYSENIVTLARGADVLVHEVVYGEFWKRPNAPQPASVVRHILASHTDAADVGRWPPQRRFARWCCRTSCRRKALRHRRTRSGSPLLGDITRGR